MYFAQIKRTRLVRNLWNWNVLIKIICKLKWPNFLICLAAFGFNSRKLQPTLVSNVTPKIYKNNIYYKAKLSPSKITNAVEYSIVLKKFE